MLAQIAEGTLNVKDSIHYLFHKEKNKNKFIFWLSNKGNLFEEALSCC